MRREGGLATLPVRAAAVLFLAALGAGCGYRLLGAEPGRGSGAGLWIAPVPDETEEPLFGAHLRAALARETVNRAETSLAGRERASAELRVKALSTQEVVVAYVVGDKPRQYQLIGEAEATLTSKDGKVLWKGLRLKAARLFSAGDSVEETENNKDRARALLAGDLAREVLRRAAITLDSAAPSG